LDYIKFSRRTTRVNRTRIYKRDNYECVYCGSNKDLTLDHVTPKSRGGGNEWTNLVTSCFKCNLKKGNKTPDEARMVMRQKPFMPTLVGENPKLQTIWNEYQKSFVS
jgi:5-methylcytosine-specific restriction endonuclease McrA